MSRKRVKKRDLKFLLEDLEREIALAKFRGKMHYLKVLYRKRKMLSEQFIKESMTYYEQHSSS